MYGRDINRKKLNDNPVVETIYIVHCVGRSFQLFLRAIVILMENLVLNMHVQML